MFLLVPAHPGFPGQIPQSRKTVVCVCVWHRMVQIMSPVCLSPELGHKKDSLRFLECVECKHDYI